MLKNKSLALSLALLPIVVSTPLQARQVQQQQVQHMQQQVRPTKQMQQTQPIQAGQRLSDFDFGAASVLPVFTDAVGTKYLILSREAHGTDKGTYDDFGGKRDYIGPKQNQKRESHPVITAAREFFEEAILALSIRLSLQKTREFIDLKASNTEAVVAYGHNVTYITDFGVYADQFFDNFYKAFNTTTSKHSKEKDRIAVVRWDTLCTTIAQNKFNTGVTIHALVLNPSGQRWDNERIQLRGFFVKKTRPLFTNQPYQPGSNKKIRFYTFAPTAAVPSISAFAAQPTKTTVRAKEIKVGPRAQKSWFNKFRNWLKS